MSEIRNETCIICLEKMNLIEDYLTPVCVKCDVMAHVSCLNEWYQKKNKKLCPICLKTEQYYLKYLKNQKNQNNENNENNELNNSSYTESTNFEVSDDEYDIEDVDDDNNLIVVNDDDTQLMINNYYRLNNDFLNRFKFKIACLFMIFIIITFYFFSIYHY